MAIALDADAPFFEIVLSPVIARITQYRRRTCNGHRVIEGVECVIEGNDPTVLGGAITQVAGRKLMRAIEIARQNRMPYIHLWNQLVAICAAMT